MLSFCYTNIKLVRKATTHFGIVREPRVAFDAFQKPNVLIYHGCGGLVVWILTYVPDVSVIKNSILVCVQQVMESAFARSVVSNTEYSNRGIVRIANGQIIRR